MLVKENKDCFLSRWCGFFNPIAINIKIKNYKKLANFIFYSEKPKLLGQSKAWEII